MPWFCVLNLSQFGVELYKLFIFTGPGSRLAHVSCLGSVGSYDADWAGRHFGTTSCFRLYCCMSYDMQDLSMSQDVLRFVLCFYSRYLGLAQHIYLAKGILKYYGLVFRAASHEANIVPLASQGKAVYLNCCAFPCLVQSLARIIVTYPYIDSVCIN